MSKLMQKIAMTMAMGTMANIPHDSRKTNYWTRTEKLPPIHKSKEELPSYLLAQMKTLSPKAKQKLVREYYERKFSKPPEAV